MAEAPPKSPLPVWKVCWSFVVRTRFVTVASILITQLKNAGLPVQFATISYWERGGFEWGDRLLMLALALEVTFFAMLDVLPGVIDNYGTLLASQGLRAEIDDKVLRLGMPFFWRAGLDAEPAYRKLVYMDLDSLSNLCKLPFSILTVLVSACISAWSAPTLWVVIVVALYSHHLGTEIADFCWVKLMNARNSNIAEQDIFVYDQFDSLVTLRAFQRQRHFDLHLQRGLMREVSFNFFRCSGQMLRALINNMNQGLFLFFGALVVVRCKAAGDSNEACFILWLVTTGIAGQLEQCVTMSLPFKECLARYRDMERFLLNAIDDAAGGAPAPPGWARKGCPLVFENVTFRYAPNLPAALENLSVTVHAAENLGIVGKTGSGKSTLASLLLRLGPLKGVPPHSGGIVMLDGVDISTLQARELRRVVAVVPQEPTMFPWNLKENIGAEFADSEVLVALERCGLDPRQLTDNPDLLGALHSNIKQGITVGQQQLIMTARALVRRPKVLILDECTASLDRDMADRLLGVVMSHTEDCTVLSIAHRLRFVLKSDRILVLGHRGRILDFDTPAKLMEDKEGYFAKNLQLEQLEDGYWT